MGILLWIVGLENLLKILWVGSFQLVDLLEDQLVVQLGMVLAR